MFTTAANFLTRHAFVVMPKTSRKAEPSDMQFTYPLPYGAVLRDSGVQFVVFSRSATAMRVLLYDDVTDLDPSRVIELVPDTDRWGDIWSVFIPGLTAGQLYHFQTEGPFDPSQGHRFVANARLIDPYAHWRVSICRATTASRGRQSAW